MLKTHGWCESFETLFFRGNMPKLFCSFMVGLKSTIFGTSKLLLALYFCEVLLIIAQVKTILSNNIYSIFVKNKRKHVNQMFLSYSWKLQIISYKS